MNNANGFKPMMGTMQEANLMNDEVNNWEMLQKIASLPDTGLAYDMLSGDGPKGQNIGGVYVAPAWSQYMADALEKYIGGKLLKNRNDQAKSFFGPQDSASSTQFGSKPVEIIESVAAKPLKPLV